MSSELTLIACILQANREAKSLQPLRVASTSDSTKFSVRDSLLLYKDRLIVPDTVNLRTLLIREIHDSVSTAHPGIRKTTLLLAAQYY
jgi:hypothetical protein